MTEAALTIGEAEAWLTHLNESLRNAHSTRCLLRSYLKALETIEAAAKESAKLQKHIEELESQRSKSLDEEDARIRKIRREAREEAREERRRKKP